eukprot:gene8919-18151_t
MVQVNNDTDTERSIRRIVEGGSSFEKVVDDSDDEEDMGYLKLVREDSSKIFKGGAASALKLKEN